MKVKALYLAMLFISPACLALSSAGKCKNADLTHVISDYRILLASLPLEYSLQEKKQLDGVMLQKYKLSSQSWSPQGIVSPPRWEHEVDIYIPDSAREKMPLLLLIMAATMMVQATLWSRQILMGKNLHVLRPPLELL